MENRAWMYANQRIYDVYNLHLHACVSMFLPWYPRVGSPQGIQCPALHQVSTIWSRCFPVRQQLKLRAGRGPRCNAEMAGAPKLGDDRRASSVRPAASHDSPKGAAQGGRRARNRADRSERAGKETRSTQRCRCFFLQATKWAGIAPPEGGWWFGSSHRLGVAFFLHTVISCLDFRGRRAVSFDCIACRNSKKST